METKIFSTAASNFLRRLGLTLIVYLVAILIIAGIAWAKSGGYWYTVEDVVLIFSFYSFHIISVLLVRGCDIFSDCLVGPLMTMILGVLLNTLVIFVVVSFLDHYSVFSRHRKAIRGILVIVVLFILISILQAFLFS